jgi:PAS domain S-box-containing protein
MEKHPLPEKGIQDENFLNALAEAFRLQEAIINTTALPIISTTPEGCISSFNSAAEDLLGYLSHEMIGKATPLVFHDLDELIKRATEISLAMHINMEPVFDVLTIHAREQKHADRKEWTLIRKDASRFPALVSLTALRDDDDSLIGYVLILNDLTDQKRRDERAAINEQKFRVLAENIPGAIYLCHNDANYSMIYLNDKIKDITGYSADDFLNNKIDFPRIYHPDDTDRIVKRVDAALSSKKSFQLQYRIRHASGNLRWVEEVGIGVYSDQDKLLMIEGFISDITVQKLAEDKLQQIAQENLRVFNNPVNLNAVVSFDGYFKRVSSSFTPLLGWSDEELKSKPFIEFVHPDDIEATKNASSYISAGNNLLTFENRYICKDGTLRWLLWGSASDVNNKLIYASAIDITERKNSEQALLQSKKSLEAVAGKLQEQNRQLDEFAHIISHNLRSPVSNINALIGLLGENSTVTDYKLIYEKLKNVSKNLNETMNELMDIMKVRSNTNVDRVSVRFKDILDKIIQSLEGDLIMAEASVTFDFNEVPNINYSKAYLESIFQNLVSNAIKYRSPDRKAMIHCETKMKNNLIELRVSDNGLGIDLERFGDKIFGLHKTFHLHAEARGVGLFLIKTQVEAMGGSISVESEVDRGTAFIVQFGNPFIHPSNSVQD